MNRDRTIPDEGVIKYRCQWTDGPPPEPDTVALLNRWRTPLFEQRLIGHDRQLDVGYGNLSVRAPASGLFVISGTQTGHLETPTSRDYTLVTGADIDANVVHCRGPCAASSETLTHAAIYRLDSQIGAVVHVHTRPLWKREFGRLPTTRANIPYGTPEMAHEFERLWENDTLARDGVAIMGGHTDGVVAFGPDLEKATASLLALAGSK